MKTLLNCLFVALGGAAGSVSRYLLGLLPVKTNGPLPRSLVRKAVRLLDRVEVTAPVRCGDIVLENICGTGIDFVASRDM